MVILRAQSITVTYIVSLKKTLELEILRVFNKLREIIEQTANKTLEKLRSEMRNL